jgi:hypothetical protein
MNLKPSSECFYHAWEPFIWDNVNLPVKELYDHLNEFIKANPNLCSNCIHQHAYKLTEKCEVTYVSKID